MRLLPQQYAEAWFGLLSDAKQQDWPALSQKMLARIHARGQLSDVNEILRRIARLARTAGRAEQLAVTTARRFDEKNLHAFVAELTGRTTKFDIAAKQDASIIGGLIAETENERWDASVAGRLRELRKQLAS